MCCLFIHIIEWFPKSDSFSYYNHSLGPTSLFCAFPSSIKCHIVTFWTNLKINFTLPPTLLTVHVNAAVTHIDDLQLPQVLHTVQSAVAAGQEVGQILLKTQILQPGGQRVAAVTSQSFHLRDNMSSLIRTAATIRPTLCHSFSSP